MAAPPTASTSNFAQGTSWNGVVVYPSSVSSRWVNMSNPAVKMALDNSGVIRNPTTDIDANKYIVSRLGSCGTILMVQGAYTGGATGAITNPVIQVWGRRTGDDDAGWMRLYTKNNTSSCTLTISSPRNSGANGTDHTYPASGSSGSTSYTNVDQNANRFDCQGCDEFVIGCTTAPLQGTTDFSTFFVRGKFV